MILRPAAFLDRDGTLIEDAHYLSDPDGVRLLPGVAPVIADLNARAILAVVITNQSGIARGLVTERQYEGTRARLDDLLADEGARLDATYHCPHHPSVSGACDCRKPATGMYERAGRELGIDLRRSLYIGDRKRDVEPALALGGTGILVPSLATPPDDVSWARAHAAVREALRDAVAGWVSQLGR